MPAPIVVAAVVQPVRLPLQESTPCNWVQMRVGEQRNKWVFDFKVRS